MATTIKKGDIITATGVRSGTSARGPYCLLKVGEKSNDRITIWAQSGFECSEGASIKVVDIVSFKRSNRKYNEQWYPDISAECVLEVVGGQQQQKFGGFHDVPDTDDDLPF
jgi:hypothetical protein